MKKKIFGGITVLAIAAVAAFNVNFSAQSNGLSDVSLTNVEALANENNCPNYGPTADRFWSNTLYCRNENSICCSY
jgi:hypothetical protein